LLGAERGEVMVAGLTLVAAFVIVVIGGALVVIGGPRTADASFELTRDRPVGWLNLSQPFWGTGALQMTELGFGGTNSSLTVSRCTVEPCDLVNQAVVYSGPAELNLVYRPGVAYGDYYIRGSNLSYPLTVNLTFEFNWSISPWVASIDEAQVIGLALAVPCGTYLVWSLARMSSS
jgi:hypothetical protein